MRFQPCYSRLRLLCLPIRPTWQDLSPQAGPACSFLLARSSLAHCSSLTHISIPAIEWPDAAKTRIQASLGCLTSTQFERTEVTPSSIVQHYKRTYSLNAPTVFPRPNVGSAVESRTCHRCGREVVLQINSAKLARRDALKLAASVGVLLFWRMGGLLVALFFHCAWLRAGRADTSCFRRHFGLACWLGFLPQFLGDQHVRSRGGLDHRRPQVVRRRWKTVASPSE